MGIKWDVYSTKDVAAAQRRQPIGTAAPPGGVTPPTADDLVSKLLKFVPIPVLGLYLMAVGVVGSATEGSEQENWLLGLLVLFTLATLAFVKRVLHVQRGSQLLVSGVAFLVYVFAIGDWFATRSWYDPFQGTLALIAFALVALIYQPKELPVEDPPVVQTPAEAPQV